jgi:hypothetical protein
MSESDVPPIEEFKQRTLKLMSDGIQDTDAMRAAIADDLDLILESTSGAWRDSPSGVFCNNHAWALVHLQRDNKIKKIGKKRYRLAGRN